MTPAWATWLWVKWGKNLQSEYDAISAWGLDPKTKELLAMIWAAISPSLQAALWAFIKQIYDKYGPETAKAILLKNLETMKATIA